MLTPPTDPSSPTPQRSQRVAVDYTLWVGGFEQKQIDTSKGSALPPRLPAPFLFNVGVGEVIPGWDRTVKQMRAGETRRVVVPPALGYGALCACQATFWRRRWSPWVQSLACRCQGNRAHPAQRARAS